MCEQVLQFDIDTTIVTNNDSYNVDPLCNNLSFFNASAVAANVATVNGIPLVAGAAFQLGGNRKEIFVGRVTISFNNAGGNQLVIVQKSYLPKCFDKKETSI